MGPQSFQIVLNLYYCALLSNLRLVCMVLMSSAIFVVVR